MSERRTVNLLWVDDDAGGLLEPLSGALEEHGFRLFTASDYTGALRLLDAERGIESLLIDIILPHSGGTGTLDPYLGFELADYASRRGIRAIAFLTIVILSEVSERFEELKGAYPQVRFTYFNKMLLLEQNTIELLAESLKPQRDF